MIYYDKVYTYYDYTLTWGSVICCTLTNPLPFSFWQQVAARTCKNIEEHARTTVQIWQCPFVNLCEFLSRVYV